MTERDVAIIGMACVFPKAPDLDTFWRNIRDGVDAITEVPASRWDPRYYDPESTAPDRFYANRGGFIDEYAQFDAAAFGIMPIAASGAEPDQLIALKVATEALRDAGYEKRPFPHQNTSIILGRGNYLNAGLARLSNITHGSEQLVESLRHLLPGIGEDKLAEIKREFQARSGVYGPDTAIGLVPNLVASRIANRLDLGGSAYTVDAACASTLVAVDQACHELSDNRADMVMAGGVHLCHDPTFWSVFSQLGALSHRQEIRPFDSKADGILIGEGVGILVLKRLSDAVRDEDRIYAVIRGTAVASDGRDVSLLTPRVQGQVLALQRAWQAAGLDPNTVGLVEAHGTATAAGDSAEIETLAQVFGPLASGAERIPLGSVKSMIGHAMPAAGAAGLIKAALAVYHGILPPTLHCDEPNAALENTRFRPITKAEAWDSDVRRAAVNAFGFGGINAHVIIDAAAKPASTQSQRPSGRSDHAEALVLAADSQAELLAAIESGASGSRGPFRLAVFDPTPQRLVTAKAAVAAGNPRSGRDGIFFSNNGLIAQGGKVAFVFPGVESNFAPQVSDIATHFDLPQPHLEHDSLEEQGLGVFYLNSFLNQVTDEIHLKPDLIAGHSVGEWSGMLAAGMIEGSSVDGMLATMRPGSLRVAEVTYLAVGAGAGKTHALIGDLPNVVISHDNCLHQSILCGPDEQIQVVQQRLREARILQEVLSFKSGFHSPALEAHVDFYLRNLEGLVLSPASIPLWSATTCAPYPAASKEIKELFVDHLLKPVHFRELILALYEQGVRVFVQVGMGSLASFIDDTLAGKPHNAVSLVAATRPGMQQVLRAAASLFVEGADIDLKRLGLEAEARPASRSQHGMSLELGSPLIKLNLPPLELAQPRGLEVEVAAGPLSHELAGNMRAIIEAQEAVSQAFARLPSAGIATRPPVRIDIPRPPETPNERTETIVMSLETYPELIDHCLFRQPADWPDHVDRGPASPMTMSLKLMMEAAQRFDPARVPVTVENIVANTWLYVEPAVEVEVTTSRVGPDRVRVKLGHYAEGTVVMAQGFPKPPAPNDEPIVDVVPAPMSVEIIYRDGWLFHGPQYQGIDTIHGLGTNGISGTLRSMPAKGCLLDNAGQLYGFWVATKNVIDRLAMPIRIEKTEFFGPDPQDGDLLECAVWIRNLGRHEARADMELIQDGRLYCRITGWTDWRFTTNTTLYDMMRLPQRSLLASSEPGGFMMVSDTKWSSSILDFLLHRFLSTAELATVGGIRQAQRQVDWLNGRIAAKDAVRKLLFEHGHGPIFPIEVSIVNDSSGRPLVSGRFEQDIQGLDLPQGRHRRRHCCRGVRSRHRRGEDRPA